jgi:predicted AAA+ superfamily ATPase
MEEKEALILLNEWWKTGKVSEKLAKPYKRKAFDEALRLLSSYRQILIITGLRRVGKTTLLYQLISHLLQKGIEAKNIIYFSFDVSSSEITKILEAYKIATGVDWKKSEIYLFLDEVQKLKNWSSQVKLIYDNFPNIRIIISGSASLQLEAQAISNLAGRYFIIELKPLSLLEYYELKYNKKIENFELYENELRSELENYLKKPFPEIVSWESEAEIKAYIKENIIAKITRGDLPDTFSNVNFSLLESMLNLFYSKPGMVISPDNLAKDFGVSKTTIENHIFYLEFAKLIRIVKNYRPNIKMESRKLKKVYPYDISLALAIANVEKAYIFETAVASALNAFHYWRMKKKEVDFVIKDKLIPVEVKTEKKINANELKPLQYFMKKYKAKKGIVVYDGEKEEELDSITILPFLRFLARF